MIAKGEKHIKTTNAFVPSIEVAFGHGKGMSQMEQSVHVGIRKSLKELGLLIGFSFEILIPVPDVACSWF